LYTVRVGNSIGAAPSETGERHAAQPEKLPVRLLYVTKLPSAGERAGRPFRPVRRYSTVLPHARDDAVSSDVALAMAASPTG
jgi:hypothetical protein